MTSLNPQETHRKSGDQHEQRNIWVEGAEEAVTEKRMKFPERLKHWVIYPSDPQFYYWLGIISVAISYNIFVIIARAVFVQLQTDFNRIWIPLDVLSYVIYIADMIVQFKTGYMEQGLRISDSKKLAKRYIKTWTFRFDVISILPLQLLYIQFGVNAPLLRINRIFKVNRLFEFFDRTLRRTNWPNAIKICNLLFYIIIIVHWNACGYYAVSNAMGFGSDSWVYPPNGNTEPSRLLNQYVYSFYWSCLTLLTIGETPHPENNIQYLFVITDFLIGVLIFASIVGNVGSIITNINEGRADFQRKLDNVKLYMHLRSVDRPLEKRVLKWFDYLWSNKQSMSENSIVGALPDKLRSEIALQIHLQTIQRIDIFKDCDPGLLKELVLKLRLCVFSPGDYICRKGDIGRDMYIVKQGLLTVVADDGTTVLATLSEGSVFGEVSLLSIPGSKFGNRRIANVRSEGYCDVFVLTKEDLWETLRDYPEAKTNMVNNGRMILLRREQFDKDLERKEISKQQRKSMGVDDLKKNVLKMQGKIMQMMFEFENAQEIFDKQLKTLENSLANCKCIISGRNSRKCK
ncbi:unnamed protein product [Owenia fusiformis]|uniref:Uncharacterized protein n=1 Tax=Owenia fusiformis TaxID=6347 RepID=A0A8J1XJ24_OWEFU|nr:unnamed protein product [Owenia fusiformis]